MTNPDVGQATKRLLGCVNDCHQGGKYSAGGLFTAHTQTITVLFRDLDVNWSSL